MKFSDILHSKEGRFSLGKEELSGKCYISIPVASGLIDYEEYYEVEPDNFKLLLEDLSKALALADKCRQRLNDKSLIINPGKNRGVG